MTDSETPQAPDETSAAPEAAAAVGASPSLPAAAPVIQALINAVLQFEAGRRDLSPSGFQRRMQMAYAIHDQATLMVQEIEGQHARLLRELLAVERRTPLPEAAAAQA